ncbi:Glyoxylase, beta-lactamase superfamily II [Solimonas aquatica]|uniref:Glyoxylase, beta-lactamase superfamily II n=1 Tax=Solimonas aquatica TaxID=489703 RepID=A0A1H9I5L9_9GAMM|nr:MBL fold metallo-hydrolase [Solimonas aquatica]SEQ69860.1 Glyoxylase, beta-lactamase superfamily II [Solimonas aquatica]
MQNSKLKVEGHFDPATWTISYIVMDETSRHCALIDTVLDYDPKSGRTSSRSADALIERVRQLNAKVLWHLETHVHADHLSAAAYLKDQLGGEIVIGREVCAVQRVFGQLFNVGAQFARDGSQFDRLLDDGEVLAIGGLRLSALHTPGHTPACMSYRVSDGQEQAVFVGDTLFMPDFGTARCDFPGGNARTLFRSIQRLLSLPPETRLYMCHDYLPGGRELAYVSTVAEQRERNIHLRGGVDEEGFVAMRTARDRQLEMPVLILPSVQVNMRAGRLPEPEDNGIRYLKIPLNVL